MLDLVNQANNAGMFRGVTFTNIERFVVGDDFATGFGELTFKGRRHGPGPRGAHRHSVGRSRRQRRHVELAVASTNGNANVAEGGRASTGWSSTPPQPATSSISEPTGTFPFLGWKFTGFEIFELATDGSGPPSFWIDFNGDATASTVIIGAGADFFRGRGGADVLLGGAGGDTYTFAPGDGNDTITGHRFQRDRYAAASSVGVQTDVTLTRSGNDLLVGETAPARRSVSPITSWAVRSGWRRSSSPAASRSIASRCWIIWSAPHRMPLPRSAVRTGQCRQRGAAASSSSTFWRHRQRRRQARRRQCRRPGRGMTVVGNTLHVDRSDAAYESYNGGGSRSFGSPTTWSTVAAARSRRRRPSG